MDSHSLEKLELPAIIALLKRECSFSVTEEKVTALVPYTDIDIVQKLLDETEEGISFLQQEELPAGRVEKIAPLLTLAQRGSTLREEDLYKFLITLSTFNQIKQFFQGKQKRFPILTKLAHRIGDFSSLISELKQTIRSDGSISDEASPHLHLLRQQIISLRAKILALAEEKLADPAFRKFLQEPVITQREDRYVFMVKVEARKDFGGIVHGVSASGATLFMEHLSFLEYNNELRKLKAEEKIEIEKILSLLSHKIGIIKEDILNSLDAIIDIDYILAKARLARKENATRPVLSEEGIIDIKEGRHPLLTPCAVPVDIKVGGQSKILVITGPNTGGKTVTLKMVGLFTLMSQSGLFVPAREGSRIGVFKQVFADIGDEQSITQNLSTFSSHITQIIKIINNLTPDTLILLDELGAGTEPSEGEALGMAILKELLFSGATAIVTTHFNRLKHFATITTGVENASLEFDINTLTPTYKLILGIPGKSYALHIAKQLGMPSKIIEEAQKFILPQESKVDEFLEKIKAQYRDATKDKQKAEALVLEVENLRQQALTQLNIQKEMQKKLVTEITSRGKILLEELNKEVNDLKQSLNLLVRQARPPKRSLAILSQITQRIKDDMGKIDSFEQQFIGSNDLVRPKFTFKPGDWVWVESLNKAGILLAEPVDEKVNVQVEEIEVEVPSSMIKAFSSPSPSSRRETTQLIATKKIFFKPVLDIRNLRVEEALIKLEKYLDNAWLAEIKEVKIIHGKGRGILRKVVKEFLSKSGYVNKFRSGFVEEGGNGVTVVELNLDK